MSLEHPNPLKPCPFCGGTNLRLNHTHSSHTDKFASVAHCMDCGARGPDGDWKYDGGMAELSGRVRWNRRA